MKKKYKILVLTDLNKNANKTLKSCVSISKIVNADIDFLYIKKPTEVVEKENQLAAMRAINKDYLSTDKKIKDLINPISENYNVKINHTFTTGNVKTEIEKYIDQNKPDIIVLGKRKSRILNFIGDNITQIVLNKHSGTVVITDFNKVLEPNNELSIGLFNTAITSDEIIEKIIGSTEKPLTSFKIVESLTTSKEEQSLNKKTVEYAFKKGDNVIENVSNYLSKTNINLLCVNRARNISDSTKISITDMINSLDCSLILTT
jgi:nucleotide-binding universal stress UspA family protein